MHTAFMAAMLRKSAFLVLLAATAAPALGGEPEFEIGARYWVSTGKTRNSHNAQELAPALGNPTSVLTYDKLLANTGELFGRAGDDRWFVKAMVGGGRINNGSFHDEDFAAGQVKFSDTVSSVTNGSIGYFTADFGGTVWQPRGKAIRLDLYGGVTGWTESVDAYGATDNLGFIGGDIPRDVKVITNKARWQGLRIGALYDWAFASKGRFVADVAWVPYAHIRNEDSHYLRTDLGPTPNVIKDGYGGGVQMDAEMRYVLTRGLELGAGLRYWYLKATNGDNRQGGFTMPIVEVLSERFGFTLSLSGYW